MDHNISNEEARRSAQQRTSPLRSRSPINTDEAEELRR